MPLFDTHTYFGKSPLFTGFDSQEAVLGAMARYGTDAVALISARARYADFMEGNHQLRHIVDGSQGIFGYVTLNTAYPDESIQEQRIYLAKHNFVASVLFPGQTGNPVILDEAKEILNAQRRYIKPIAIYVNDREGVNGLREIASEFTSMKFIMLNMAGDDWRYAANLARSHANVLLEFSGTHDADKIAHCASIVSGRKLLFGSAQPYGDPHLILAMLRETPTISDLDHKRIGYQNALAVFNIDADVE